MSITPTQFASVVNSDGRTVRKFLRSVTAREDQPGKGGRWALPSGKRDIARLTKQFREWSAKQAEEAAKRAADRATEAAAAVEVEDADTDA